MLISGLISLKLVSVLAKDMVNLETTKRVTQNLFYAGRQFILSTLQNESNPSNAAKAEASTEYLVKNWIEALFSWFQMVILWHDPFISLCTITGIFSSFLLLTYLAPRFYATIMIAIFVYNLTTVWFRHIWPEIRVPPGDEIENESRLDVDRWTYLHPHLMTLTELAFIGNRISGSTLIFCIIAALVSAPGIYLHLLPKAAKVYLRNNVNFYIFQSAQTQCDPKSETSSSSASVSLFEKLMRKNFTTGLELTLETLTSARSEEAVSMKVPINENQLEEVKNIQEKEDSSSQNGPRKGSDDLSSNESTSLIDFEEDQQDGFVIL